jgi:hypothetical protein
MTVDEHEAELFRVARVEESDDSARVVAGCFAGGAVALVYTNRRLVAIAGEPGKLRRVAAHTVPDLTFAGPLDVDGDGRAEIGAVAHSVEGGVMTVRVEVLRVEGSRLHRLAARDAYRVSAANATWIGARLDQIDLLLDVSARFETLHVGGLYVQRSGSRVRNVAPLHPIRFALRSKRPATPASVEGGAEAADAGVRAASPPSRTKTDAGVVRRPGPKGASGRAP